MLGGPQQYLLTYLFLYNGSTTFIHWGLSSGNARVKVQFFPWFNLYVLLYNFLLKNKRE